MFNRSSIGTFSLNRGACRLQVHVEAAPQVLPGEDVLGHHRLEASGTRHRLARRQPGLRDGVIARGVKRGELLQRQRLALVELHVELLPDVARLVERPALRSRGARPSTERLRSCRLRDVKIRLAGAHQQTHAVLADDLARQRLQVSIVELVDRAWRPR